jgi:uncharacterized membrane protein YgcG
MEYRFGGENIGMPVVGDLVFLQRGVSRPVVLCEKTGVHMLNIDADDIQRGDLPFIKSLGLTISNPDTQRPIALGVDFLEGSWGERVSDFLDNDAEEDDDDSDFFDEAGSFLGGFGNDGFGGDSFGGFGGGMFSGGGASEDF